VMITPMFEGHAAYWRLTFTATPYYAALLGSVAAGKPCDYSNPRRPRIDRKSRHPYAS